MQLQMTAPLDIGMEQQDQALRLGQDDVFDLEDTRRSLKNAGVQNLMDEAGDEDSEDNDVEEQVEDEEMLDEEEEREKKVRALEDDLDTLYQSYQERMNERDAKYRVKEARRKDKSREEWGGIREKDSDDDDESEREEGGWDQVQAAKAHAGEDSDSSDEDESDSKVPAPSKKRRRVEESVDLTKSVKKARTNGSVTFDGSSAPHLSRTAQMWFSQDFFKSAGVDDVEDDDEEEDAEGVMGEEDVSMDHASASEEEVEVCRRDRQSLSLLTMPTLGY
jgi:AdoMet-dependent rRNA methyltransferase SPB1